MEGVELILLVGFTNRNFTYCKIIEKFPGSNIMENLIYLYDNCKTNTPSFMKYSCIFLQCHRSICILQIHVFSVLVEI
jgi:hypothetical protein